MSDLSWVWVNVTRAMTDTEVHARRKKDGTFEWRKRKIARWSSSGEMPPAISDWTYGTADTLEGVYED